MKKIMIGLLTLTTIQSYANHEKCSLDVRVMWGTDEIKRSDCKDISSTVKLAIEFAAVTVGYKDSSAKENKARALSKCNELKSNGESLISLHQAYALFYFEDLRKIDCSEELKRLNLSRDSLTSIID